MGSRLFPGAEPVEGASQEFLPEEKRRPANRAGAEEGSLLFVSRGLAKSLTGLSMSVRQDGPGAHQA